MGPVRRGLALALVAVALATLGLAGLALIAEASGETRLDWRGYAIVALAGVVLAALWAALTIADGLFDRLDRLRGDALVSAGRGDPLPEHWSAPGAGDEVAQLAGAISAVLARSRAPAEASDERLRAILAAAAEGVVVVTPIGLVSLANAAARAALGDRLTVGASVFAVLDRSILARAIDEARGADTAVEAEIRTVGGEAVRVRVADIGAHGGAVLTLPGPAPAARAELHHDLGLHDAPPDAPPPVAGTPLAALPLLVVDVETTGLDVGVDRIVSLGAVRMHGPRIYPHTALDRLVAPGMPIPPRSTAVHGISDALVANAPPFAEVLAELRPMLEGCVVAGHNIGFDFGVIAAECSRAGLDWDSPPALDTARLYAALEPNEAELDLAAVATRLGVSIEGRHTALGDSLVCAEILARLITRLEAEGVRTLGEAQALGRTARRLRDRQQASGWPDV